MNDCYWGGENDQFYYECDTGRIVGEIKQLPNKTWSGLFHDAFMGPNCGNYIDDIRCRKAVESAHRRSVEEWERKREAWRNGPTVVYAEEPKKSWWKFWK